MPNKSTMDWSYNGFERKDGSKRTLKEESGEQDDTLGTGKEAAQHGNHTQVFTIKVLMMTYLREKTAYMEDGGRVEGKN